MIIQVQVKSSQHYRIVNDDGIGSGGGDDKNAEAVIYLNVVRNSSFSRVVRPCDADCDVSLVLPLFLPC